MGGALLYINHLPDLDWLIALEFGRVDDGQPTESWRGVSEAFGYLHEEGTGRALGFKILGFSEFDPDAPALAAIWGEPHFDVPLLGLRAASAGEIVVAARALLDGRQTVNRILFQDAIGAEGDPANALQRWLMCLQAGDSMAHFGLGYTLYELGRFKEAYRHLRYYAEIAPAGAWNWCWYGKAAQAIGEIDEAIAAYERALELEAGDEEETDAGELLRALEG